ncbi:MAG: DUF3040 domain-containing protein [Streptosporangiaceae bacterium]
MEVSVMGLSVREQRALHSIETGLAASYPRLASRLAVFTRLTSGEAFPAREHIRAHRRREWVHRPLVWPLVWLVVSVALIFAGLAVSHGGVGTCARALASSCARYTGGHVGW